jgi:hypothetical protein
VKVRGVRGPDSATAEDWYAEINERGLLGSDWALVAGFTLLGGSNFDLEPGAVCSVLTLEDGVEIRAELGEGTVATIPYRTITGLDIADRSKTRGGGFIGIGVEGLLVASMLNKVTRKTKLNTGLAITTTFGELLLSHGQVHAEELRQRLSLLFTRYQATQRSAHAAPVQDDPVTQIERLQMLHEQGLLTEVEFEAARSAQVRRLTGES